MSTACARAATRRASVSPPTYGHGKLQEVRGTLLASGNRNWQAPPNFRQPRHVVVSQHRLCTSGQSVQSPFSSYS
jgi:hypothetical protein